MSCQAPVVETSIQWAAACAVQQRFMQPPRQPPQQQQQLQQEPQPHQQQRHSSSNQDVFTCSAECRQLYELGGDCFDFWRLPDNRLALTVADASGKGLPAALMISNVQSSLRTAALFTANDGAAVLGAVNRQVFASSLADRYATLFYGVFDETTRTLEYANAGHNPPMVIGRGAPVVWLEAGGAPVGMFPDWHYEKAAVQLQPGDLVIAYTDGVVEAQNPAGHEWGVGGLQKAAATAQTTAKSADEIVQSIFTAMEEFSCENQTDDATILVLRVN